MLGKKTIGINPDTRNNDSKMKKFWTIVLTLLLLLIPIGFLYNIIHERESYREKAVDSVASSWGDEQAIKGVSLFYNDRKIPLNNYKANINIETQIRKKGIFKIPLYIANVVLEGDFISDIGSLKDKKVIFSFDVQDSRGFIEEPIYQLNNSSAQKAQSTNISTIINSDNKTIPFKVSYKIRGLNAISLLAQGINNDIDIKGNWNSPSFNGSFLPENRQVDKNSFNAHWQIPNIAKANVVNPSVEVSLLVPVDNYRMTERTLKYSFLFLALTFISYFIFEITSKEKTRIHPLQYCMLGGAMQIFYLLLVSISEFAPFILAYIISSLMIISLISIYTYFVITKTKGKTFTITIASLVSALYIFLYILLQLQDLALLIGSLGMFVIICAIMYVTRNIDWYNSEE